jgi:trk system potassium uptake protein TrkA
MSKKNGKKQFMVIGLGRFGRAIAETLCEDGAEVLGVDSAMDMVEEMRDQLTHVVQMDAMDRDALATLGVQDFDIAFVTMGSDIRASGTIVLLLKELGAKQVIAKAQDEFHGRMLEKLGADQVLFPERDMGRRVAHSLLTGNVIEYMELSTQYSKAEIRPKPEWIGKTLKELAMRSEMNINVVAIRSGDEVNAMPQPETRIREGDLMMVVISEEMLKKMR